MHFFLSAKTFIHYVWIKCQNTYLNHNLKFPLYGCPYFCMYRDVTVLGLQQTISLSRPCSSLLPVDILIFSTFLFFHLCISVCFFRHPRSLDLSSSFILSLPFCSYSLSFLSCVFTGRMTCFIFFPSHFSSSPFQFSSLLQRVFHYPPLAPLLSGECGGREEGSLERQR